MTTTASTVDAPVGRLSPPLMAALRRHQEEALTRHGFDPTNPGQGSLVLFEVVRALLTELGHAPAEEQDADEIASTLMWQTAAVINWLRDLDAQREIPAADWDALRKYPALLRATAGQLEQWVERYEEGK
jgi:hypothetical protein